VFVHPVLDLVWKSTCSERTDGVNGPQPSGRQKVAVDIGGSSMEPGCAWNHGQIFCQEECDFIGSRCNFERQVHASVSLGSS
jgi:hypothetical protein